MRFRYNPPPRLIGGRWVEFSKYPEVERTDEWGTRWVDWGDSLQEGEIHVEGGIVAPLYHATPSLSSILATGFKTGDEAGYSTLGSGRAEDTVSFTQDLTLACEIAHCIREAIQIANGQLTLKDIANMAERHGVLEKALEWWKDIDGQGPQFVFLDLSEHLDLLSQGRIFDMKVEPSVHSSVNDAFYAYGRESSQYREAVVNFFYRPATADEQRKHAWSFYRRYLYTAMRAGVRTDPNFMTGIRSFTNHDINEVGVIEAVLHNATLVKSKIDPPKGAFTYSKDQYPSNVACDRDEYRVIDTDSLEIIGVYECDPLDYDL